MGVIAFIPAKSTSRRLPGKNMRLLCGRPLVYYSIRAAQLSKTFTEVVVSSEDDEVLQYARQHGSQLHRRDPRLSTADVGALDVMRAWWKEAPPQADVVALLQPTHPVRDPEDLSRAIGEMRADAAADSMFAVVPMQDRIGRIDDGVFIPEAPFASSAGSARFRNSGSFYLLRPERTFLTGVSFGRRIRAYVLPRPEQEVNVDYEHELAAAEVVFRNNSALLARYD